jgi:hypothetical protein
MYEVLMKSMLKIDHLVKTKNTEKLLREIDLATTYRKKSSIAAKKYLIKEGFSYDSDSCDYVYKNGSDVLKAFFQTEDLYQEIKYYIEEKLDVDLF